MRTAAALVALTLPLASCATGPTQRPQAPFPVVEATIPQLQQAMAEGRLTARQLVMAYLARIGAFEDQINGVMSVNPNALAQADALDRERAAGRIRGPLHGIPIALKDNIQTLDMPTTAGALVLDGFKPPYEATLVANLRDAGAVIIAKTVMSEWAGASGSTGPLSYSTLGGFSLNPYDPRRDPRPGYADGRGVMDPGGSSSGVGTAASFWAASVGTDTSGSILNPSYLNVLVGIRPTVGRISRWGVIPNNGDLDTAGPMARTVTDAAILLGVLEGRVADANDAATRTCTPPTGNDYRPFLDAQALKGARIGVPRAFFYESAAAPGESGRRGGLSPDEARVMAEAITVLREHGATIVDPADIPSIASPDPGENLLSWTSCPLGIRRPDCRLWYAPKRDLEAWLRSLGSAAPVRSVAELREWNAARSADGAVRYGQARFDAAEAVDLVADLERYRTERAKTMRLAATEGLGKALEDNGLDALLFPGWSGGLITAQAGYPTVIVPFGLVPNSATGLPANFRPQPQSFGVSFTGGPCSEPRLIALAYAFEQITKRRVAPSATPELGSDDLVPNRW
jgi:amidase